MDSRNIKRGQTTPLLEDIEEGNIMGNYNSSANYKDPTSSTQRKKSQYEVGHYYKYNTLKSWVNSKGTDPMNRSRRLHGHNIKKYRARLINSEPAPLPFAVPAAARTLKNRLKSFTQTTFHKYKQLKYAARDGNEERVKEYLQRGAPTFHWAGANGSTKYFDDFTPLAYASANGDLNIVNILLKAGANVNGGEKRRLGWSFPWDKGEFAALRVESTDASAVASTPLAQAIQNNHIEIVKVLLNADALWGPYIVDLAIERDNYEILQLLLAGKMWTDQGVLKYKNFDPTYFDMRTWEPFPTYGQSKTPKWVITKAIEYANQKGRLEIVRLLNLIDPQLLGIASERAIMKRNAEEKMLENKRREERRRWRTYENNSNND